MSHNVLRSRFNCGKCSCLCVSGTGKEDGLSNTLSIHIFAKGKLRAMHQTKSSNLQVKPKADSDLEFPLDEINLDMDHDFEQIMAKHDQQTERNEGYLEGQSDAFLDAKVPLLEATHQRYTDVITLQDILFHDESVLYFQRNSFWQTLSFTRVITILWPLLLSVTLFVLGFYYYLAKNAGLLVFFFCVTMGLLFVGVEVWLWHSIHADRVNILTNSRIVSCIYKAGHVLSATSLPYLQVGGCVQEGQSTVLFRALNPLQKHKADDSIRFEHVKKPTDVIHIVNTQMEHISSVIRQPKMTSSVQTIEGFDFEPSEEFANTFDSNIADRDMYYTSLKSFLLLRSDHPHWDSTYQQLLHANLEDDIEGKEIVLWSYSPPYYRLWRNVMITWAMVSLPILILVAGALAFMVSVDVTLEISSVLFGVAIPLLMLSFFVTLLLMGHVRSAFAITSRGVVIIRTGVIIGQSKVKVTARKGLHYSTKLKYPIIFFCCLLGVSFASIYPLQSSVNLKTSRGYMQLLQDSSLSILAPDAKIIEEILYKSYIFAKKCGL